MSTDAIMLDSPAQTPTPTPKSHNPSQPPATNGANGDITMSETAAPTNWLNNQKWRDEYTTANSRLEHRSFKTPRDPMFPPMAQNVPGMTPDLESRLRNLVAKLKDHDKEMTT
ncbi:hypothetical protein N8I77_004192 [Diaporthe amygdali]|uniref:Uncharacterized protein n=1 Tax=Phomopsis amygdali TaxID=1214568 RepID=A0AAD9SLF6_PHOAM|nr:uncharacterized protein J7T55_008399 [Diaporthe amygdali]KAJ0121236.1 hypothetical protein J7T55_008399 [Diaporthe amygdali]KAK2610791.1 hypothetical protein N8I77_004192 [Diaporthe amygdali]